MASKSMFHYWKPFYTLFFILLLIGSCIATRPGGTMKPEGDSMSPELFKRQQEAGYRRQGMVFNLLPKGTPIPPSGPSKRHNSFANSSPPN
ncbi:Protein IDA [Camellia lanceoleosa]|uniref:Protein IDA n=1 Tax=Camellia lanceoleosa TaxID=1840588 RepID=A0ACC0IEW8_9ERIC|nr:Protein IDA [Camellia lanceoleosa]